MMSQALSVSEFVSKIQETVRWNPSLKNVALVGELSNFHAHRSGHFYFTLKDDKARIDCVMFASFANKVLFKPKDGDKVLLMGYTDVYVPQGRIQFYAQKMNLDGLGDLHLRFEALKKDYYEKGAFVPERKKTLPIYPEKIAVITGKGSAAWADIEKTLRHRWPLAEVIVRFAYVQGEKAQHDLFDALGEMESLNPDVIIMARGGGSIEDLWAFNEPKVVDKVLALKVPVIAAIGHESDTTLAELASDHRAATPTAAAVAASPDKKEVFETLRHYKNTFYLQVVHKRQKQNQEYERLLKKSVLSDPQMFFHYKQEHLDHLNADLYAFHLRFKNYKTYLKHGEAKMEAAIQKSLYEHQKNLSKIQLQSPIERHLWQEKQRLKMLSLDAYPIIQKLNDRQKITKQYEKTIEQMIQQQLAQKQKSYAYLIKRLDDLSPIRLLAKGYLQAYDGPKKIQSIHDVEVGDVVRVYLKDGATEAEILRKDVYDDSNEI